MTIALTVDCCGFIGRDTVRCPSFRVQKKEAEREREREDTYEQEKRKRQEIGEKKRRLKTVLMNGWSV